MAGNDEKLAMSHERETTCSGAALNGEGDGSLVGRYAGVDGVRSPSASTLERMQIAKLGRAS